MSERIWSAWRQRTDELRAELAAIAEPDPRWWLLAGGAAVAERWPARAGYMISDAEPGADTFIGCVAPAPVDPIAHGLARAHAARDALRELDGQLPEQPLAVTIQRELSGAATVASALDVVAFAAGTRAWWVPLALGDAAIAAALRAAIAGEMPRGLRAVGDGPTPYVTVSLGDDRLATARHGHRRGWDGATGLRARGPWLGLGRAGGLDVVSTCHLVIDGYGHTWLTARIAALVATRVAEVPTALPPLAEVAGAVPLGIAWRPLAMPAPRALPLAYGLGRALHRAAGRLDAPFSPTLQIPVAPGHDPARRRRRVVPAVVSLRVERGEPESPAAFDARARAILAREADGHGLCSRLLAAGRAAPTPLAWKRRAVSTARPPWLDRFADVVGGRGCVSRMRIVDAPVPPACAVSSPARMPTARDPLGACVISVIDDGERAAITACGSGTLAGSDAAAAALLDEIVAAIPH